MAGRKFALIIMIPGERANRSATMKISSIHSKPFWTPKLTEAANKLRDAKKVYNNRNTITNKEAYDSAKENFDSMRKSECERFILGKLKT